MNKENINQVKEIISRDIGLDIDELRYDRLAFWMKEASKFDVGFLIREENQVIRDAFAELLYDKRVYDAVRKIDMSEQLARARERLEDAEILARKIRMLKEAGLVTCDGTKGLDDMLDEALGLKPRKVLEILDEPDEKYSVYRVQCALARTPNLPKECQEHIVERSDLDFMDYRKILLQNDCDPEVALKIIDNLNEDLETALYYSATFLDSREMREFGEIVEGYCERNRDAIMETNSQQFLETLSEFGDRFEFETSSRNPAIDDFVKDLEDREEELSLGR